MGDKLLMANRDETEMQERLTRIFAKYNRRIGLKRMVEILDNNARQLEDASKRLRAY